MDKEVKQKWVSALQSGKYQQCEGKLFDGVGYCCLGVLEKECGDWEEHVDEDGLWSTYLREQEFGLNLEVSRALVEMNDGGSSFQEIANYIEENL